MLLMSSGLMLSWSFCRGLRGFLQEEAQHSTDTVTITVRKVKEQEQFPSRIVVDEVVVNQLRGQISVGLLKPPHSSPNLLAQ